MHCRLIALLLATALAACQQPSGGNGMAATSDAQADLPAMSDNCIGAAKPPRFFPVEFGKLREQFLSGLVNACFAGFQDKPVYDACLRKGILETFDDSGKAQAGCGGNREIGDFSNCVLEHNLALDMLHRLGAPTPAGPDFWSSKQSMKNAILKAIAVGSAENCGAFHVRSAALTCIDRWVTSKLDIPPDLLQKCPTGTDDVARGECIGDATSIRFLRTHLPRLYETGI
jgi:hypothetical protein